MSLLPDKPSNLKGSSRVRRGTNQANGPLDNATESEDAADKSRDAADDDAAHDDDLANSDDDSPKNFEEGAEADDEEDANPNDGLDDQDDDEGKAKDNRAEAFAEDDTDHNTFACSRTPSPDLQGASRTTGGVLRGRAAGNVLNIADTASIFTATDHGQAITGRVLVYENKTDNEPAFTMKHLVTSDLRPILTRLAEKHPPIRSKPFNTLQSLSC